MTAIEIIASKLLFLNGSFKLSAENKLYSLFDSYAQDKRFIDLSVPRVKIS